MSSALVGGLDLSLTGAGMAALAIDGDDHFGYVQTVGYDLKKATLLDELRRIDDVRDGVLGFIDELDARPDLVAIEEMPYGAQGKATLDRATLWNDVARGLVARHIPFVRVNVTHLKMYATGKGSGVDKDEVMLAIARRYPDVWVTNNNEADAFGLAAMAARKCGHPIETKLAQTYVRAMEKMETPWNEHTEVV